MTTPTIAMETHTLEVPGAVLTYDVRQGTGSGEPTLLLIGYPMAAAGFNTLAGHFTDRTVVTYDPRGSERSVREPGTPTTTPDIVADDLHALISALGVEPVDMFASSGGAIDALALVARHRSDVRKLVAHEPPLCAVLPDSRECAAAVKDIHDTYQQRGWGHSMAKFMAVVMHQGSIPADWASRPAPDPAMFGMPADDDGKRDDPMFSAIVETTGYQPDFDALRKAEARIVIAAGEKGEGTMANRGAHGVAQQLGLEPVIFPSDHGGFLGGEYGWPGQPEMFAANLHEVLAGA